MFDFNNIYDEQDTNQGSSGAEEREPATGSKEKTKAGTKFPASLIVTLSHPTETAQKFLD